MVCKWRKAVNFLSLLSLFKGLRHSHFVLIVPHLIMWQKCSETYFWFTVKDTKAPFFSHILYSLFRSVLSMTTTTAISLPKKIPIQSGNGPKSWEWPYAAVGFNAHPFFIGTKAGDQVELIITDRGQGMNACMQSQELIPQSMGIQSSPPGHFFIWSPAFWSVN